MLAGGGSAQGMTTTRLPATARTFTFNNLEPDAQGFFMVRAVNGVRNNVGVQGMAQAATAVYGPNTFNRREAGVGSWAHFAEPPISLGFGNGRDGAGLSRVGLGTPRHYRAEWFDTVYAPMSTLARSPATGNIGAAVLLPANLEALLADGVVGNTFTATRNAVGTANSVALTYNSRWFMALRENRVARLDVTITSEDADPADAYVFAHCLVTNRTRAINGEGFFGREEGLNARGMVGTGAAGSWTVNTGAFNHANFGFFATQGGTYTITFALVELTNDVVLTTQSVNVTVNAAPVATAALLLDLDEVEEDEIEDPEVEMTKMTKTTRQRG
jgi:hypothetical protein